MTVYVDVLFAVNALMDYATLLAAARLGGIHSRRGRIALAALLGGAYAVLGAVMPVLGALPLRLAAGVGICAVAYYGKGPFVRVCALYLLVSAAFAGVALALGAATGKRLLFGAGYYLAVPLRLLLLAAAVGYAVSGVLLRGDAAHGAVRRQIGTVTVSLFDRRIQVNVLRDTGNELAEPASGKPALILGQSAAARLLGERFAALQGLTAGNAAACFAALPPELARRAGLLPYQAVGTANGLLLFFRPDGVWDAAGKKIDCVLAIGTERMDQGGYEGLLGV